MGARNRVGIGLSCMPASLNRLAESILWSRFRGSFKYRLRLCEGREQLKRDKKDRDTVGGGGGYIRDGEIHVVGDEETDEYLQFFLRKFLQENKNRIQVGFFRYLSFRKVSPETFLKRQWYRMFFLSLPSVL
jgi:hypothetical protein